MRRIKLLFLDALKHGYMAVIGHKPMDEGKVVGATYFDWSKHENRCIMQRFHWLPLPSMVRGANEIEPLISMAIKKL